MEGNRIVSLQSDRNPLQEEAFFARIELAVSRPPSSVKKLTPSAFIGPRVSIAMATKSRDCVTPAYSYLAIFLSEASSAAAPLTADVLGKCEVTKVQATLRPMHATLSCASVYTLLAAIKIQPSGFLLWRYVGFHKRPINDAIYGVVPKDSAGTKTAWEAMAVGLVNFGSARACVAPAYNFIIQRLYN